MKPSDDEVNFIFGVAEAIKKLRPGCEFEIVDRTITQWWHPDRLSPPSWEEIQVVYDEDRKKYESLQYARDRKAEFPSIEKQLDMLWHSMNQGDIPGKDTPWFKTIMEIKQKYPKPE